MTLRRVPGSRTYRADDQGFKEISLSPGMATFMTGVGERLAGNANAVGQSRYDSELTTIRAGWENESRVAARVYESDRHWKDSRDAILLRVVEAARVNGKR